MNSLVPFEHLGSAPYFSRVHVTRSFVVFVMFYCKIIVCPFVRFPVGNFFLSFFKLFLQDTNFQTDRYKKKSPKRINFMKYSFYLLKSLSNTNAIKLIYKCKHVNDNQIYLTCDIDDKNRLMFKCKYLS